MATIKTKQIATEITLDVNDIIWHLVESLSRDELIEFVKDLDREVSDYDFKKELKNYFQDEVEEEEDGEDYEFRDDEEGEEEELF